MKLLTDDNMRLNGIKVIKGLLIVVAVVAGVILTFSLGSIIGEFFTKLLN